jgi:hypothetical protein
VLAGFLDPGCAGVGGLEPIQAMRATGPAVPVAGEGGDSAPAVDCNSLTMPWLVWR